MNNNIVFDFGDWEITKRELIASISIICILVIIGLFISNGISNKIADDNLKYDQALQITDTEMFRYGMNTSVGNAFVYGKLKAVDTVSYEELEGQYIYIKKVKERYTQHSRTVIYTTGSGKNRTTHTRTEHYWTWDRVSSEDKKCEEISFLNVNFDSNKIIFPNDEYITTIKKSSHIRYKYYGVATEYIGTIFANLKNGSISYNTSFYDDLSIEDTIKQLESNDELCIIFWMFWILLTVGLVFGFFVIDNEWLE